MSSTPREYYKYLSVAASVLPAVFPPLVDPTAVECWLAETPVDGVVQATHPLRQVALRTRVRWVRAQSDPTTKITHPFNRTRFRPRADSSNKKSKTLDFESESRMKAAS